MSQQPHPQRSTQGDQHVAAVLAFSIPGMADAGTATVPDWIQIFPAGPVLATNDGRAFVISDAAALVERLNAAAPPTLCDYEHRSYYDAALNGDTLASGWAREFEARTDGIWARVEWTPAAAQRIRDREYRFVSPEFTSNSATGEVIAVQAIALVNRPAFKMAALARSAAPSSSNGDHQMTAIALALGLPEDADEETILAAINQTNTELASARHAPALDRFVPRADYDTVMARATSAETELASQLKTVRDGEVNALIDAAVKEGKIAPASREHYVALAATDAGLAHVKQLCASLPKLVADPSVPQPDVPGGEISDYERHIAASMGVSEEDFIAARGGAH